MSFYTLYIYKKLFTEINIAPPSKTRIFLLYRKVRMGDNNNEKGPCFYMIEC